MNGLVAASNRQEMSLPFAPIWAKMVTCCGRSPERATSADRGSQAGRPSSKAGRGLETRAQLTGDDFVMFGDKIEQMKRDFTDKYVQVDATRPELARFRDVVGRVK